MYFVRLILTFLGFDAAPAPAAPPVPAPRRQPSARRVAPVVLQTVASVAPSPEAQARRNEELRKEARVAFERRRDVLFAQSVNILAIACDRSDTRNSDPGDVAKAKATLPGDVQAYLRVRVFAGLRIPTLHGRGLESHARARAFRTELCELASTDFGTWNDGLAAYDRAIQDARRRGLPLPEPIDVPSIVEDGIAKLAVEKLRRIEEAKARRAGGGGNGGGMGDGGRPSKPGAPPKGPRRPDPVDAKTLEPDDDEPQSGPKM